MSRKGDPLGTFRLITPSVTKTFYDELTHDFNDIDIKTLAVGRQHSVSLSHVHIEKQGVSTELLCLHLLKPRATSQQSLQPSSSSHGLGCVFAPRRQPSTSVAASACTTFSSIPKFLHSIARTIPAPILDFICLVISIAAQIIAQQCRVHSCASVGSIAKSTGSAAFQ